MQYWPAIFYSGSRFFFCYIWLYNEFGLWRPILLWICMFLYASLIAKTQIFHTTIARLIFIAVRSTAKLKFLLSILPDILHSLPVTHFHPSSIITIITIITIIIVSLFLCFHFLSSNRTPVANKGKLHYMDLFPSSIFRITSFNSFVQYSFIVSFQVLSLSSNLFDC